MKKLLSFGIFLLLTTMMWLSNSWAQEASKSAQIEVQVPATSLRVGDPFDARLIVKGSGELNSYILVTHKKKGYDDATTTYTYPFSGEMFPQPYNANLTAFEMGDNGYLDISGNSFRSPGTYDYTIDVYDGDQITKDYGELVTSYSVMASQKLKDIRNRFTPLATKHFTIMVH